jgi:hypothetical protein
MAMRMQQAACPFVRCFLSFLSFISRLPLDKQNTGMLLTLSAAQAIAKSLSTAEHHVTSNDIASTCDLSLF